MKNNKALLGFLGGIAAGALLGVLYAPDKGSKTRKKIKQKGGQYADDAKDKAEEILENFSQKYETLKAESKDLIAQGKSKLGR
ncbi:MAG: YtxH domain-containing protein [Flavobacteriaceae bacterium]|uniref:YtxH domain-containing protein n=1 Tax=Flavobacterium kayseriense TaxID=2764714 RepID=A0ABR7JBG5_9FLAO|nr:YtxH domain-containing protein [Flavobacterium kayseriense]MBC5842792.1 YtxH domain-containing protein [Flavobacterium kayseriense]MBC5849322.1 YtxH domain-containing protein [Flavobacterium kayseriense]MBU0941095.1 YtxH domain-containing protein [Bacteroidota bacterium]MBX9887124.1 YtxH domain-containing protein [Flavobacteriaceae bacterium]